MKITTPNFCGEEGLSAGTGSFIGEEKVKLRDCLPGDSEFTAVWFSDLVLTGTVVLGCEAGAAKLNLGIELTGNVNSVRRSGRITYRENMQ